MSNLNSLFGGGSGSQVANQPPLVPNPQIDQINQQALTNYQNLYNQAGTNQGGYVQAQIAPTLQSNATGYGNLMQSQALRGIQGSSFGDQDISNYMNNANTNVQNATANALQSSYGLQSGLNQGIAGIGNTMNSQQIAQFLANLQNTQANRSNASTNANLFGSAVGGVSSLLGNSGLGNWFSGLFGGGGGGVTQTVPGGFAAGTYTT